MMSENENQDIKWKSEYMMDNARSLQRVAQSLDQNMSEQLKSDPRLFTGKLLAVPILLSLVAEIALKALLCWKKNKAPIQTHDLQKLYLSLGENTQELLEARLRKVSPNSIRADHPGMQNLNPDLQEMFAAKMHPLRDVLRTHCDSHMRFRYLYENMPAYFDTSEIELALKVIIETFD